MPRSLRRSDRFGGHLLVEGILLGQEAEHAPGYANLYRDGGLALRKRGDLRGVIADNEKALEVAPLNWIYRKKVEEILEKARKSLGDW